MNILIITQYFYPENFRINDLAEYYIEKGHKITVLTGYPNYPEGKYYQGYRFLRNFYEQYNSININRVPIFPRGKNKILLVLNYLSYLINSSIYVFFIKKNKFDIIFVYEPSPITVMIPAMVLKSRTRTPIYFWMLDLWPDSLVATKTTQNKFILNIIERLVAKIYQTSDKILISSYSFERHILSRGGYKDRILYFPNWADKVIEEISKTNQLNIKKPELPKGFNLLFAGNLGEAQDLETLIKVGIELKKNKDINFIILGKGRKLDWLKTNINENKLNDKFFLLGDVKVEEVFNYLKCSDVLYLSLKKDEVFKSTVPGKLPTYLLSGKPIISAVDGETYDIIKRAEAGIPCEAGDVNGIVKAVLELNNLEEEEREKIGLKAQHYYWCNFSREITLNNLIMEMENTISGSQFN